MSWSRKLSPPLILKDGRAIKTLSDACVVILNFPDERQRSPRWLRVRESLFYAADDDDRAIDGVQAQLSAALGAEGLIQGEQATVDTVIDLTLAPK